MLPIFFFLIFQALLPGEGVEIYKNLGAGESNTRIAILSVIISGKRSDSSERYGNHTYSDTVAFATRSKELYAKRHGYDLIIARESIEEAFGIRAERQLEAAWTKVALIARYLSEYDWVFWTDADSAILNFDIRLEDFLDRDFDIIACDVDVGEMDPGAMRKGQAINTGEVFYKNSETARSILIQTWQSHPAITPGSFEQQWINASIHDQGAECHVKVYPQKAFNTHPDYFVPGDFIIHLYGFHGRELIEKFKEIEERWGYLIELENDYTSSCGHSHSPRACLHH